MQSGNALLEAELRMDNDQILVSEEDTVEVGPRADRGRKIGEFKPTNMPLSAVEIAHRRKTDWFEDAEDLAPLPENPSPE